MLLARGRDHAARADLDHLEHELVDDQHFDDQHFDDHDEHHFDHHHYDHGAHDHHQCGARHDRGTATDHHHPACDPAHHAGPLPPPDVHR